MKQWLAIFGLAILILAVGAGVALVRQDMKMMEIVVASQNMAEGEKLQSLHCVYKKVRVPLELEPWVIKAGDEMIYLGYKAALDIKQGEALMTGNLVLPVEQVDLQSRVRPGRQAILLRYELCTPQGSFSAGSESQDIMARMPQPLPPELRRVLEKQKVPPARFVNADGSESYLVENVRLIHLGLLGVDANLTFECEPGEALLLGFAASSAREGERPFTVLDRSYEDKDETLPRRSVSPEPAAEVVQAE